MSNKRSKTSNGPPKAVLTYEGCSNFRQRLVLSCITSRPVRIINIRPDDECPGERHSLYHTFFAFFFFLFVYTCTIQNNI